MKNSSFTLLKRAALFGAAILLAPIMQTSASSMTIDELKSVYLECERGAVLGKLAGDDYAACAVIYEDLKRRAFHGNYSELKVWWDAQLIAQDGFRRT